MPSHFAPQPQVRLVHVLVVVHITTIGLIADVTLDALTRLRSYLRSAGRYGASPFLVGHYGGLGEISQGFCRVSAVNGGVYILDRKPEVAPSGDKFVVQPHDFPDPLTADVLITAQDQLPASLYPSLTQDTSLSAIARCIAVIDKPIPFPPSLSSEEGLSEGGAEPAPGTSDGEDTGNLKPESTTPSEAATSIDTSVIVFPPNSVNGGSSTKAAQAFTTGAGTLSAPQGKCKHPLSWIGRLLTHRTQMLSTSQYQSQMAKTLSHRSILTSTLSYLWRTFLNRFSSLYISNTFLGHLHQHPVSTSHPFSYPQLYRRT